MDRFQNTGQPDWEWWGRLWPTPEHTLETLGVESGHSLAEIGCGNGYFALPAARVTAPAPVYPVDLAESLLAELADLAATQGIDNVEPIHGDARDLPALLPEPVDVALVANTFHGIEQPEPFLQGVHHALVAGGRLVVVNWQDRPREETTVADRPRGPPTELRLSPAATEETVREAASFSLVDHIELPPYHYALVFER